MEKTEDRVLLVCRDISDVYYIRLKGVPVSKLFTALRNVGLTRNMNMKYINYKC